MIITKRFVFIHMHKTGGQTLNDIISQCIPSHRAVGYHFPHSEIPQQCKALPRVGMVRNPWDWYLSWYAFNRDPAIENPLYEVLSEGGRGDFKTTVSRLIELGSDSDRSRKDRAALIAILPDSLDDNTGAGLNKDSIRDLGASDAGYYSWLFRRMLGDTDDNGVWVGKFENYRDDFIAIMQQLSVEETAALKLELDKQERRNASIHSHYSHYYDAELRDLVATAESELIDNYGYRFERVGHAGDDSRTQFDASSGGDRGFKKLLGRADNFLLLRRDFDVGAVKERVGQIAQARWRDSRRELEFEVHRDTQALVLVRFEDYRHPLPQYLELYDELEDELRPVLDFIARYYRDNGFIVRVLLAKLRAGGSIASHRDSGYSLLNCHRVHIPITTNDKTIFTVGGEDRLMRVGEFWEINNALAHAVVNRGDEDRIHLIIDWMPNFANRSQALALLEDPVQTANASADEAGILRSRVVEAYRLHNSGQLRQAETIYREVLAIDAGHADSNNLLGLLCIQGDRFEEAARHIGNALLSRPDDAQAHANRGFALKSLKRFDEACTHFRRALLLAPGNPETHNDLGSVYRELGRFEDAIASYQRAVELHPDFAEAHNNLGCTLMIPGRYTEAVASLRRSLDLNPDLPRVHANLAQALAGLGNPPRAG
jgi:Flp pilus assembly protein TadD